MRLPLPFWLALGILGCSGSGPGEGSDAAAGSDPADALAAADSPSPEASTDLASGADSAAGGDAAEGSADSPPADPVDASAADSAPESAEGSDVPAEDAIDLALDVGACSPMCEGRQCGDDGCGGTCGTCPASRRCEGAWCVPCWENEFEGAGGKFTQSIDAVEDGGYVVAPGAGRVVRLDSAGAVVWDRTYQGARAPVLVRTRPTVGFVLAGSGNPDGGTNTEAEVRAVDALGEVVWSRVLSADSRRVIGDARVLPDGGVVVAGAAGVDVWIAGLDAQGTPQWEETLGSAYEDGATGLALAATGGFFVVAPTATGVAPYDARVVKTSASGTIQWDRTFGGGQEDRASAVLPLPDGGCVVAGYTRSQGAGGEDSWVFRLDPAGQVVWEKVFGTYSWDRISALAPAADGGILAAGLSAGDLAYGILGDAHVLNLTADGEVAWERKYAKPDGIAIAWAVATGTHGGFAVAGGHGAGNDGVKPWVFARYSDGDCCAAHAVRDCVGGDAVWLTGCGEPEEVEDCGPWTCVAGTCCTPEQYRGCVGVTPYWFDACGTRGAVAETCGPATVCDQGTCRSCPPLEWVDIPGGTFQMGAADLPDATPIHQVTVPSFRIARTEVSTCQYRACADAGACMFPAGGSFDGPVLGVDLAAACAFCSFAGGRLCSEAEWEYAARNGAKGTLYPWGDQTPTCQHGVFSDAALGCASPSSLPGCSRPAGNDDWGVCDLAGNAWEWVQDCYLGTYDGAPADGSPREVCPGSDLHAKRGASFVPYQMPDALRSSRRWAVFPGNLPVGGGVRCCAAPNP